MLPRPELEAAALGLVQGAADLLPVSSSAHVGALPWLLGWECAEWPAARRKELEVSVDVGVGRASSTVWTCDLTKRYVEINGDYRS